MTRTRVELRLGVPKVSLTLLYRGEIKGVVKYDTQLSS